MWIIPDWIFKYTYTNASFLSSADVDSREFRYKQKHRTCCRGNGKQVVLINKSHVSIRGMPLGRRFFCEKWETGVCRHQICRIGNGRLEANIRCGPRHLRWIAAGLGQFFLTSIPIRIVSFCYHQNGNKRTKPFALGLSVKRSIAVSSPPCFANEWSKSSAVSLHRKW